MKAYLAKERHDFDLDLDFPETTTPFQREVYQEMMSIEYGRVTSYGKIAQALGKPDQARAVGQAVGANPIPIVIPCHRVVGADGRLIGYSGGLAVKVSLLRLEGIDVDGATPNSRVHPEVIPLDLR
ncbi:MAG: MGMT family protein [Longimicrobiales bacterium]|nr:MGMT family protein [Longimicrobiales bacterium]